MKKTLNPAWNLGLLMMAGHVSAAGFALVEQSASGMGNAFAGAAAVAEDASTIYFNPAGMVYLPDSQLVLASHLLRTSGHFNNQGSTPGANKPINGNGGDLGDIALLPNFYYAQSVTPNIRLGLGVSAPFGLKTEYDANWLGRFQAIKSDLKTININPSIAFKVNDRLSLGAGVSAMYIATTLTRAVNFYPAGEGAVRVKGEDWGFGFNLGAMWQITPDTRFGMAYRSKIMQKLDGTAKFTRPPLVPAALAPDGDITANTTLPENFSLSAFSKINQQWDVMGDVTWTHWSRFKELRILKDNGTLFDVTPENWKNTLRYSLGSNYHFNEKLKLRTGVAFDQEAINSQYRTARIPGNDRTWLALGAQYKINDSSIIDIAYSHLFIRDASINDNQTAKFNGRVKGVYNGDANIFSAQYTYNF
ncbi:MAG: outer membrane protein transport protein [Methylophilaceae bacterium]